ncbi:ABC transporter ATP-binding protein [Glycomyces buryatensis]|uniref:ABC transporter ATP-binding protein n=1 Tax=Glycomyces buryatensis TaxID=2570927 RepID=A0A4S8QB44_9ACTN|nr:ABC transporter ATP-binding protein [Glycomyces buryatensis]THV41490.1 ABC transporter ATP-binding protein [Glycomyces buryatensis]
MPADTGRETRTPRSPAPLRAVAAIRRLFASRWQLLRQLRQAPGATTSLTVLETLAAVAPTLSALGLGWLVSRLEGIGEGDDFAWDGLVAPLVLVSAMFILQEVLAALGEVAQYAATGQIDRSIRRAVRAASLRGLSVAQLEVPAIVDDLARASDVGEGMLRSPGSAATGQLRLLFRFLAAGSATVLLSVVFSPLLAVVLLVMSLCIRALIRRQWMGLVDAWDARERYRRRSVYWTELGRIPEAGKDIRMFGLGRWVVGRRTAAFIEFLDPLWPLRRKVQIGQWPVAIVTTVSGVLALLVPSLAMRAGAIDAADLVVCLSAAFAIFQMSAMGHEAFDIEYGSGAVEALERLREMERKPASDAGAAHSGPVGFETSIRCEGVSFTYPGTTAPVIRNLDLEIKPREVIGLVGRNGVGKTTLIRLLAAVYRPDGGSILVDGVDLVDIPAEQWHARVSVVFQDFGRFPATLADNIAIGASEHLVDREGVRRAARLAGIDRWSDDLPAGLDTVLGREFDDGVDLSGGQWQSVAIARALFAAQHGRDLLVFDEPTAHLDARSEAAFFDRVTDAIDDAAIVLISHRLGTIRHADRIVMLGPDGIIEQGSHDELVEGDGEYARLFALQASQFAESASPF